MPYAETFHKVCPECSAAYTTHSPRQIFCSRACSDKARRIPWSIRGIKRKNKLPYQRFIERVQIIPNGCWEWQGCKDKDGYGAGFAIGKRSIRPHRFSYTYFKGEIPGGYVVCHSCDNPSCVNPGHLFLGTHQDNQADKVSKNRQARGSRHAHSKLTENEVREMRVLFTTGNYSIKELGKRFGCSYDNALLIVKNKHWKGV